jgi:RHS repeat-associated protein
MGRRFRKEVNGTVTWFQYADEGLIAEYAENGALTRAYGWKPGGLWGTDAAWIGNVSGELLIVSYFHTDAIGSPKSITSSVGAKLWSSRTDAFGRDHGGIDQLLNPLGLAGQYRDEESGDLYNFMRTYDPGIGRYKEHDPLGLAAGPNSFSYSGQSPTEKIDPTGLCEISGTWQQFPHVIDIPSFEACPDQIPGSCIRPGMLAARVYVQASGNIEWSISCTRECCTGGEKCCGSQDTWMLDGDAKYLVDLDVNIPIPMFCQRLRYPLLVASCFVGRAARNAVGVYKYAKVALDDRLPGMFSLIERMVDPNLWCKMHREAGRYHLDKLFQ